MIINEAMFRGLFNDVILNSGICLRMYLPEKTFYRQLSLMNVCVWDQKVIIIAKHYIKKTMNIDRDNSLEYRILLILSNCLLSSSKASILLSNTQYFRFKYMLQFYNFKCKCTHFKLTENDIQKIL